MNRTSSYQPALYGFTDGSVLFLKDNPWKGSTEHRVYQFCLICGQKSSREERGERWKRTSQVNH